MNDAVQLPTSFKLLHQVRAYFGLRNQGMRSHAFHPSEMASMCPVKYYLYDKAIEELASPDPEVVQAAHRTVRKIRNTKHDTAPGRLSSDLIPDFHVGDAIHEGVQFWLGVRGLLWGEWECPWCRVRTAAGFMPRMHVPDIEGKPLLDAAPCTRCAGQNLREKTIKWRYVEPWAGSVEWGIDGRVDGLLFIPYKGVQVPAVLEIKSINENGYTEKYGGPLPTEAHVKQASIYGWNLSQHEMFSGLRHIYFVYVNKNAVRNWKEYLVPFNMDAIQMTKDKIETVRAAKQQRKLPVHARACSHIAVKDSRECPMVFECWGEHPPSNIFDADFDVSTIPARGASCEHVS